MTDDARARRRQLALDLEAQIGDDPRLNAVALRHVLDCVAEPGLLAHRVFADHEVFFDPRDDKIGFSLLRGRQWQRRFIDRALAFLRASDRISDGGTYIDVGANIGCTVLYAMRSGAFGSALAVEPEPHNRNILMRNLEANALLEDVDVIAAAVGAVEGTGHLKLDRRNFGKHAIVSAPAACRDDGETIEVPVCRLDKLLEDRAIPAERIPLVKIDAEGFEAEVLAGARRLIEQAPPLILEVSGFMSNPEAARGVMSSLSQTYATSVRLDREPWTDFGEPLAEFTPECDQHELLVF